MIETESGDRPKARFRLPLSRHRMVELLVVVFGVMIALGLDNLVEEIRLHGDARDLEKAFQADIVGAVGLSWERQLVAPCLSQNLERLAERVAAPGAAAQPMEASSTGSFVFALPQAYRAPSRLWTTASFDRALGSEAFKRIPYERADAYAVIFAQIAIRSEANAAEFLAIADLAPLTYPQPDMDPEVRANLLQAIARLDRHNAQAVLGGDQLIRQALTAAGSDAIRAHIREGRAEMDQMAEATKQAYGACIDLGATDRLTELANASGDAAAA